VGATPEVAAASAAVLVVGIAASVIALFALPPGKIDGFIEHHPGWCAVGLFSGLGLAILARKTS
jgi:hypothetical protein